MGNSQSREEMVLSREGNLLRCIRPSKLFEQLFVSLLGLGLGIAESSLSADISLSKLFHECKEYVLATCRGSLCEKVDDLCEVYETERMLLKPEEVLKIIKHAEDATTPASAEPRSRFKRLIQNFGAKDKGPKEQAPKNGHKNSEDNTTRQSLANFFDSKSSLFSKKPPKPWGVSPVEKSAPPDENEWTMV